MTHEAMQAVAELIVIALLGGWEPGLDLVETIEVLPGGVWLYAPDRIEGIFIEWATLREDPEFLRRVRLN